MRILLSGASGLIGRRAARELLAGRHQLTTLHRGSALEGLPDAHFAADVRSPEAREAAARAEAVVHLAALGDVDESFQRPFDHNDVNACGTLNLLEGVREGGGLFLLASSQRIYRLSRRPIHEEDALAPASPYAYSKVVAETYCREYAELLGVQALILRFFSVYGPGQRGKGTSGVVAIFLERALAGLPLVVHGQRRRDFTHVDDVAHGIALALERPWQPGSAYNIATGVGTSLLELAEVVREVTGSRSPVEHVYRPDTPKPGGGDADLIADCSRARHDLGYEPRVSLRQGLEAWLQWKHEHG